MQSDPARRLLMPEDLPRPFRHATRRDPDLKTRGGAIAVLAESMGRPLKAHQQYIVDVATEINPPGSHFYYRRQLVIVNEPRQIGKTTIMRPVFVDRCLTTPKLHAFTTAQLGKDARERWIALCEDVKHSPVLREFVRMNEGKGSERLFFPNSSFVSPFAPEKDALHGESPELVLIDEGWAFPQEQGGDLMRAIRPAMITKRNRQLWIISAAGDASSDWWEELCEAGRQSVNDPTSPIAYFEHSMDPDADPYDPASWEFHPGLDGLITIEDLAEEAKPENNTHADFLRGFMNIPTRTRDDTVIPLDKWDALTDPAERPALDQLAIAYDVALDLTAAAIWSAWTDELGQRRIAVVETRPGWDWIEDYIADLHEQGAPLIAADDGGPTRIVTGRLQRRNIPITTANGKDATTAWSDFKARVGTGIILHDGSPALRASLEIAVERPVGETSDVSRRKSLGPIDTIKAAVTASWAADFVTGVPPIY